MYVCVFVCVYVGICAYACVYIYTYTEKDAGEVRGSSGVKAPAVPPEDPTLRLGGSQLPVTSALYDQTPFPGLYEHIHTCIRHIQIKNLL